MTKHVKARRRLTPSNSISFGSILGGALAVVAANVAATHGVTVTPEMAAAFGTLATAGVGYLTRGGRKDEPQ